MIINIHNDVILITQSYNFVNNINTCSFQFQKTHLSSLSIIYVLVSIKLDIFTKTE